MPGSLPCSCWLRSQARCSSPARVAGAEVLAQVEGGRGTLVLGPEPLIGAQRVQLRIGEQSLAIGTDGLQPFAVLAPVGSAP